MDLQIYLGLANRTLVNKGKELNLYHSSTGVFTEVAELVDNLKRHIYYGKDIDYVNLKEELGDICWYFAILFNQYKENITPNIYISKVDYHPFFYSINKKYTKDFQYLKIIERLAEFVNLYTKYIDTLAESNKFINEIKYIVDNTTYTFEPNGIFEIITVLCDFFDVDFNEVLELNIKKLEERYRQKNGGVGFSEDKAINRNVENELKVLSNEKNGLIIAGFPGIGKSYYCENNTKYKVSDSDSSKFRWVTLNDGRPMTNEEFPDNYIEHIKKASKENDIVFVSTHKEVIKKLIENNLKFFIVYPSLSRKSEFMELYKKRGSNHFFINLMENNFENFIQDIESYKKISNNITFIELIDVFISDIIDDLMKATLRI